MKYEIKISLICIILCIVFMFIFSYVSAVSEHTYYVYQVGIYKDEVNKDKKIAELNKKGFEGYCYQKNNQFYVLSFIGDSKKDVEKHSSELKGIIKEYKVSSSMSREELLKALEKGESYD